MTEVYSEENYALWPIEKERRKHPPRLTERELIEAFPDAKDAIVTKIAEYEDERTEIVERITQQLMIIHKKSLPENRWFWREMVKHTQVSALVTVDRHLGRLRRLSNLMRGKKQKSPSGGVTQEMVERARETPIEDVALPHLQRTRHSGKNIVALCPFRDEKTPSFYIYPETNSCWCYGCQQGGDVINFAMLLHGIGFPAAVRQLLGTQ